jgi:hypothetical protein
LQLLVGSGPNSIVVDAGAPADSARATRDGSLVKLVLGTRAAARLATDPAAFRYRYEVGS